MTQYTMGVDIGTGPDYTGAVIMDCDGLVVWMMADPDSDKVLKALDDEWKRREDLEPKRLSKLTPPHGWLSKKIEEGKITFPPPLKLSDLGFDDDDFSIGRNQDSCVAGKDFPI